MRTVIGGSGFIGAALLDRLEACDRDVWAPERGDLDIFNRDLGTVFYCAGLTADFSSRPFDTVEAHVGYLAKILELATFEHLIYLSSTRLYDQNLAIPSAQLAKEIDDLRLNPLKSRHLYDLSKALGENLCLNYSAKPCSVLRLSCVVSFVDSCGGFLPSLIKDFRYKNFKKISSSSLFSRDYISLSDVIDALIAVAESPRKRLINVASGINISNSEIAAKLISFGKKLEFELDSSSACPVNMNHSKICDVKELRRLGIDPVNVLDLIHAGLFQ